LRERERERERNERTDMFVIKDRTESCRAEILSCNFSFEFMTSPTDSPLLEYRVEHSAQVRRKDDSNF